MSDERIYCASPWPSLYYARLAFGGSSGSRLRPHQNNSSDLGARIRIIDRNVPLAFRIVAVQCVVAAMLTMMFLMWGRMHAVAALLAGIVVIAPGVGFAWRVAATRVATGQELSAARRLLGSGIAKLLMTFGLLFVAFAWCRPEPVDRKSVV